LVNTTDSLPEDDVSVSAHLALLRLLEQHPDHSQRQLAIALGVSLGKAHYLLKALLGKGWVKAQNFQRSDRKLGYLYILTPEGARNRLRLTRSFLGRKEREYQALQAQIALLRDELAATSAATPNPTTNRARP
jgi:EPS-associated MarR family transcriptional regulator